MFRLGARLPPRRGKLSSVRVTDEGGDKRRRTSQGLPLIRPSVRTGAPSPHRGGRLWAAQIGRNLPLCGTFGYIYWELGRSAPVGGRAARCAAPTAETWQARAARRVVAPYKRGVWSLPPHPPPSGAPSPRGEGFWGKHPSAVWLDRQSFTPLTRETAAYGRVRIPGPYGDCGKPAGAQCAPLQERGRKPGPSSAPVCALGHLSLSPLPLRDIIPTPFGLRPFPPDRGNRPLDKGSRPPGGRLRKNKKGQVWDLSLKT